MKTFFKIISVVFQPIFIPTMGMTMLMNMEISMIYPLFWRLTAIIGTFLFTGVFPALPIYLMIKKGDIKDVFISDRKERTMPYFYSLLAYILWALFMWKTLQFPLFIVAMGLGSALSIIIILFINLKWKISAHLSGMGGLVGGIFAVCYRLGINPVWLFVLVFVISALVALSRIELKAHTPAQTLGGFTVGFFAVSILSLFF